MLTLDPVALTQAVQDAAAAVQAGAGAPGAIAYVARGAATIGAAAGTADLATGTPAQADMAYEIGSQTKTMMATVVLQLVAEGRLELDAPVARYLDGTTLAGIPNAEAATLRQLLDHSSGIPDCDQVPGSGDLPLYVEQALANPGEVYTVDDFLDLVRGLPPEFPPGTQSAYSNTGYLLLQKAVEAVAAEPLGAVLAARIFAPLGMRDTRLDDFAPDPARWSSYAQPEGAPPIDAGLLRIDSGGDGGVVSTAGDMAKFQRALLVDRTLLPADLLAEMLTPFAPPGEAPGPVGYGLGIDSASLDGVSLIAGHTGGTLGTTTLGFTALGTGTAFGAAANGRIAAAGAGGVVAGLTSLAPLADALATEGGLPDALFAPVTQVTFASGSAAELRLAEAGTGSELRLAGLTLDFASPLAEIAGGDVVFLDGSRLIIGDGVGAPIPAPPPIVCDGLAIARTPLLGAGDAAGNRLDIARLAPSAMDKDNQLLGLAGDDTLAGGHGRDRLSGGEGADVLRGGGGNDMLDGGAGPDRLRGGSGDDTYLVDDAGDRVAEAAGEGIDTVLSTISHRLPTWVENLVLTGGGSLTGTGNGQDNRMQASAGGDSLRGLGGGDLLLGGAGKDLLEGGAGDDSLLGGEEADLLRGGPGADLLLGGLGSDTLVGGAGGDAFRFLDAAEGGDRIRGFRAGEDRLEFSAGGFGGGLSEGMDLTVGHRFVHGGAATEAFGQFLFEPRGGALFWDGDGTGAEAPVLVAILEGRTELTGADLHILG